MSNRMKGFIVTPALVTVLLSACTSSPPPQNNDKRIERFTRPSVVMIIAGCDGSYSYKDEAKSFPSTDLSVRGFGSGYFVTSNGYIVTNAHVVEDVTEKGEAGCKEKLFDKFVKELAPTLGKKPEEILQNKDLRKQIKEKSDFKNFEVVRKIILPNRPKEEPTSFKLTKADDPEVQDIAVIQAIGVDNAPVLMVGNSESVQNTDQVWAFGYPRDSFIGDALKVESGFQPSAIPGKVSNTKIILKSGAPVFQVSGPVSPGNSGGPLVNGVGEAIGMVTFRDGKGNPGIFYAIPTKTIRSVIREATGEVNQQGRTDELYRKGLEFYWQGNYADAVAQFTQVRSLFERHSEVDELILQSTAAQAKLGPNYLLWLMIAGIVSAIPVLAFILYRRGLVPASDGVVGAALDRMTGFWQPTPATTKPGKSHTILDAAPPSRGAGVGQAFLELETRLSPIPIQCYLGQDKHQLGRDSAWSDFDIPEQGWDVISRRHAVLRREGGSYRIFDGDGTPSANGIWFEGKRIDPVKGFLLTNGVQLQFGQNPASQVTLTYVNPTEKAGPKPTYVEM